MKKWRTLRKKQSKYKIISFQLFFPFIAKIIYLFNVKNIVLLLSFIFCISTAKGAFVSQDHPALRFCEKYALAGQFVAAYPRITPSIQALPWIPFVGISMVPGLVEKPNIITYICNTLTKISSLDVKDASFFIASELNDMTGNKWDKDLEMFTESFSLAETLWDFENGKSKKGAFKSISTHSQLNNFFNVSYSWYNKRFNDKDVSLKNRHQREQDLNELAEASYKSAVLTDMTNCPSPANSSNIDYQKIYKEKIQKHEKVRDETKNDIIFYEEKILQMGIKIAGNEDDLNEYIKKLKTLSNSGVAYKNSSKTKTEITSKKDPKKKDENGNPIVKKVNISRKVFSYTTITFNELFADFINTYEAKWQSWVIAKISSGGYQGLFDNPSARVEQEFQDFNYECRSSKIVGNIDPTRPDYEAYLQKEQEKCIANLKTDHQKVKNLLTYYINELKKSLEKHKKANAEIWTFESDLLGVNRNISLQDSGNTFPQENIVCAEANMLDQNEQILLQNKKLEANNSLKEIIAKNYIKQTNLKEERNKQLAEEKKEMKIKAELLKNTQKNERRHNSSHKVPVHLELPKQLNE